MKPSPGISSKSKGIKKETHFRSAKYSKDKASEDDFEEGEVVEKPELYPLTLEVKLADSFVFEIGFYSKESGQEMV